MLLAVLPIQWAMRFQSFQNQGTLAYYLQEVSAEFALPKLTPASARDKFISCVITDCDDGS